MAIRWNRALSVGIESIDEQHRELLRRAAAFVRGVEGRSRREVGILLSYLRAYAVTHFGEEEDAMQRTRYPGYHRHRREHDRFLAYLLALSREQERPRGSGVAPNLVASWLQDWFAEHVRRTDMEMARYFTHLQVDGVHPQDIAP